MEIISEKEASKHSQTALVPRVIICLFIDHIHFDCRLCDAQLWLNKEMRDSPASLLIVTVCVGEKHLCQIRYWTVRCKYT